MTVTREDLIPNASNQEKIVEHVNPYDSIYAAKYNPLTFPKLAFEVLSSKPMQTKSHLCVALQCSKRALYDWIEQHEEFAEAVEAGLAHGEALFRDKLSKYAFEPTAKVNNGLIKLMASNVYGISDNSIPTTIINNNNYTQDPEKELKDRGIPIPDIGIDDIPSGNNYIEEKNDD